MAHRDSIHEYFRGSFSHVPVLRHGLFRVLKQTNSHKHLTLYTYLSLHTLLPLPELTLQNRARSKQHNQAGCLNLSSSCLLYITLTTDNLPLHQGKQAHCFLLQQHHTLRHQVSGYREHHQVQHSRCFSLPN